MAVYVDNMKNTPSGQWCHMGTDNLDDLTELHEMAQEIGFRREWFQDHPLHPHYDLRATKRAAAIRHGAIAVKGFEFIGRCSRYGRWIAGGKVEPPPHARGGAIANSRNTPQPEPGRKEGGGR